MNSLGFKPSSPALILPPNDENGKELQEFFTTDAYQIIEPITSEESKLSAELCEFVLQDSEFDTSTYNPQSVAEELEALGFQKSNTLAGMVIQAAKQSNGLQALPKVITSKPGTLFVYEHHDTEDYGNDEQRLITREEIISDLQNVIMRCHKELHNRLNTATKSIDLSGTKKAHSYDCSITFDGMDDYEHWQVGGVRMTTEKVDKKYGYWSLIKPVKAKRVATMQLEAVVDEMTRKKESGEHYEVRELADTATIIVATAVRIANTLRDNPDHFAENTGTSELKQLLAELPDLQNLQQRLAEQVVKIDAKLEAKAKSDAEQRQSYRY